MESKCYLCKYNAISLTGLWGGHIFEEEYCGFTNTDEYCGEEYFEPIEPEIIEIKEGDKL